MLSVLLAYEWLRGIAGASADSPQIIPTSISYEEMSMVNKRRPSVFPQTNRAT